MAIWIRWVLAFLPFLVLLIPIGLFELHAWYKRQQRERYVASLPVTKDACPYCGWVGFANWGVRQCVRCGKDVNVDSNFVKRCLHCKEPIYGLGPSVCSNCGAEWWIGTYVQRYPGAKAMLDYYAQRSAEYAQAHGHHQGELNAAS